MQQVTTEQKGTIPTAPCVPCGAPPASIITTVLKPPRPSNATFRSSEHESKSKAHP